MDQELDTIDRKEVLTQELSTLISKQCFCHKKLLEEWIRKDQSLDDQKFIEFHKKCVLKAQEKLTKGIQSLGSSEANVIEDIPKILGRRLHSVFQISHDTYIQKVTMTEQKLEKVRKEVVDFYWTQMLKRLNDCQLYVEVEDFHKEVMSSCIIKLLHRFPSDLIKLKFLQEMNYMENILKKEFGMILYKWRNLVEHKQEDDYDLGLALNDLFAEDGLVEVPLCSKPTPIRPIPVKLKQISDGKSTFLNHIIAPAFNNVLKRLSYEK